MPMTLQVRHVARSVAGTLEQNLSVIFMMHSVFGSREDVPSVSGSRAEPSSSNRNMVKILEDHVGGFSI